MASKSSSFSGSQAITGSVSDIGIYVRRDTTGMNVEDERACAAMLTDIPVGESPIGGSAQLPP